MPLGLKSIRLIRIKTTTDRFAGMRYGSVPLLFLSFPFELSSLLLLLLHLSGHQQEGPLHILQNLKVISSILNARELALI